MTPQEVIDNLRLGGINSVIDEGVKYVQQADEFPPQCHMDEMGLKKNDPLCAFADKLIWGTYGRPAASKFLYELDTEHLQNILATQRQIPAIYSRAIMLILQRRAWGKGWKRRGETSVWDRIWGFLNAL